MRIHFLFVAVSCFIHVTTTYGQQTWKIAGEKISTVWSEKIDPTVPLPEYPRPQMVRDRWMNLNGLWDFAIAPRNASAPSSYEGKLLVPYPVESALSGVAKRVGEENILWYKRVFTLPSDFRNKNVLLHFGAVDWRCTVIVNGKQAGTHEGGYDPFFFDITPFLKRSGQQEIVVRVWDPSDDGPQPRGKQVKKPESIWYTPVTGIWQTVWLEAVPETYIASTQQTTGLDKISVKAVVANQRTDDRIRITAWDKGQKIGQEEASGNEVSLSIPNGKHWSPADPFLYDLTIALVRKGKVVDEVKSYFGLRKIDMGLDENGVQRMMFNDRFLFQYGPLDQGWWPDGLYTAPTDEALRFDVVKTKEMGFNMIRKHVKVEPARWYYHCDKAGILVWQDMPSGDMGNRWDSRPGIIGIATEKERTAESEKIFREEWKAIMDATHNFPSIVVWVPFNEAWGQFKTEEIVKWTMEYDPSRLVNTASGGNFFSVGHIIDLHNYPEPAMPSPDLFGKDRAIVLGEYGGLGLPLEGHTWQSKDNWGYKSYNNPEELLKSYQALIGKLQVLIPKGLSAAVYTQTTDVEIEVNGLMTYDRKVIKMPETELQKLHQELYKASVELKGK